MVVSVQPRAERPDGLSGLAFVVRLSFFFVLKILAFIAPGVGKWRSGCVLAPEVCRVSRQGIFIRKRTRDT